MKNLQKNLLYIIIAALVLVGGGFAVANLNQKPAENSTQDITTTETKTSPVTLTITDGANTKTYEVKDGVGKTALDVTDQNVDLETSGEGVNAFVTGINGRKADSDKKEFWELIINGKSSEVGAGSYTVKEGDKIEWKISNF